MAGFSQRTSQYVVASVAARRHGSSRLVSIDCRDETINKLKRDIK
jgi:hypothetical protein